MIIDTLKEFLHYKEFECKIRKPGQSIIEFVNNWESLYIKCKVRDDAVSDRVLVFKLMLSCNLSDMDHKLVFREAKSAKKDRKVFE